MVKDYDMMKRRKTKYKLHSAHETITLHTFNMHTQLARVLNGSCSSHPLHVSIGQGSYIVCHMNIVCF